ncbi:MAG TPA: type II secretion system protein GspE, partial [Synergistales bacterium]|nr:type II secretion system protein GspE [Synergistales bacterium]
GWLDEKQLTEAISRQMQIPLILLASYTPDPSVLKLIPRKTAEKYQVLPLKLKNDGTLLMATAEPLTLDKIHELEGISNRKIEFRIARASSMKKEINRFYSSIIFLD